MPHLQRFATPLLVVAALIAAVALAAAPTSAQDGGATVKVFVIANDQVNDEDAEEQWQMQVTVRPTGGCTTKQGVADYSSRWLNTNTEVGVELSVDECIFRIDVAMREASDRTDCWYTAQLSWEPAGGTSPADDYVLTSDAPDGVSRISAVRKSTSVCAFPPETRFYIDGPDLVEDLPGPSADADLLALARRAAEIASFEIRVEPDDSADAVPAGCNRTANFTVLGDGQRVWHSLMAGGGPCRFRASVARAQAPFEAIEGNAIAFTDDFRFINLTSLVRLPQARIAIIQDVQGSDNRGTTSYTIARSCGGQAVTSPAASATSAALDEGRYTVHAPSVPSFGATAIYPAVAAGVTANTIVGCSVTVSLRGLLVDCIVEGGSTQTLTWTAASPIRHFDFEFDIRCGTAAGSPTTTTTTSTTTSTAATTVPAATDAEPLDVTEPAEAITTEPAPVVEGPLADMPTG